MHKKLIWLLVLLCVGWNTPRHYRHHMSLYYTGSPIPTVTWTTTPGVGYYVVPGANENGIVLVNGSQSITLSTTPVTVVAQGPSILFQYPNLIPAGTTYGSSSGQYQIVYNAPTILYWTIVFGANETRLNIANGFPGTLVNPVPGQIRTQIIFTPNGEAVLEGAPSALVTAQVYNQASNLPFTGQVYPYTALPFTPQKFFVFKGQVWARGTDGNMYQFGGANNNSYDECVATVQVPFFDMKNPGLKKTASAIDADVTGTWNLAGSPDWIGGSFQLIASVTQATFDQGFLGWSSEGTHFSLQASSSEAALTKVSSLILYYTPGEGPQQ